MFRFRRTRRRRNSKDERAEREELERLERLMRAREEDEARKAREADEANEARKAHDIERLRVGGSTILRSTIKDRMTAKCAAVRETIKPKYEELKANIGILTTHPTMEDQTAAFVHSVEKDILPELDGRFLYEMLNDPDVFQNVTEKLAKIIFDLTVIRFMQFMLTPMEKLLNEDALQSQNPLSILNMDMLYYIGKTLLDIHDRTRFVQLIELRLFTKYYENLLIPDGLKHEVEMLNRTFRENFAEDDLEAMIVYWGGDDVNEVQQLQVRTLWHMAGDVFSPLFLSITPAPELSSSDTETLRIETLYFGGLFRTHYVNDNDCLLFKYLEHYANLHVPKKKSIAFVQKYEDILDMLKTFFPETWSISYRHGEKCFDVKRSEYVDVLLTRVKRHRFRRHMLEHHKGANVARKVDIKKLEGDLKKPLTRGDLRADFANESDRRAYESKTGKVLMEPGIPHDAKKVLGYAPKTAKVVRGRALRDYKQQLQTQRTRAQVPPGGGGGGGGGGPSVSAGAGGAAYDVRRHRRGGRRTRRRRKISTARRMTRK